MKIRLLDSTKILADRRWRASLATTGAAASSKLVTALAGFLVVRITFGYLGVELYGLWMALTSGIALLTFADVGLGNGLLNQVAIQSAGPDASARIRELASSALAYLAVISGLLIIVAIPLSVLVDWRAVFKLSSGSIAEDVPVVVMVLVGAAAMQMLFGAIRKLQLGLQRGYWGYWSVAAGQALAVIGVWVAVSIDAGLVGIVIGYVSGGLAAALINALIFFLARPDLAFRLKSVKLAPGLALLSSGSTYLILQVLGTLSIATDGLLIGALIGTTHVAQYAVLQKIFTLGLISQYITAPLWPAFTEACARGDYRWASSSLRASMILATALAAGSGLVLLFAAPWIVEHWLAPGLVISPLMVLGFAAWTIVAGYGGALAPFMNGVMARSHLRILTVAAAVAIVLKLILIPRFGATAAIWCSVVAHSVLYAIPAARTAFGYLRTQSAALPRGA
ncbi:MAG: oligosaccharide flippase family protein [Gemmatimonadota bacterium]